MRRWQGAKTRVLDTGQRKDRVAPDTQTARRDARHVRSSYVGRDCGAHVADTGSEPCPGTRPSRKSSGRQRRRKVISIKVPHNEGHGWMQRNLPEIQSKTQGSGFCKVFHRPETMPDVRYLS